MKVLVDSDALFGLFVPSDPHHKEAKDIFEKLVNEGTDLMVLNIVIQEMATVLSHKVSQMFAIDFVERFKKLKLTIIKVDEQLENSAWEVFLKQKKKGTSFVDCANMAAVEKYKLGGIVTFDDFYPKQIRVYI